MSGNSKSTSASLTDLASEKSTWTAHKLSKQTGALAQLEWTVVATITLLVIFGFGLRAGNLGALGFAEDEINKLEAVHSYERGDISANSEHPMLMKAFMLVSLRAAHALGANSISDEAALRIPNAVFGALTVIPIFLLTAAFFDRRTGLLAAAFWAFGINAIALNRIGKEDTLLVFFTLFAFYFYLRAKQLPPADAAGKRRSYILSATSFGLMLASKYFPHYFGLNALYHHIFHVRSRQPGETGGKTPNIFYPLIFVVFLIANPAVLLPQVWEYLNAYMGQNLLLAHTGYLVGDTLYKNNMQNTPFWGTPLYFYVLFMAIKIPLSIIVAFVTGLVVSLKRRREPGYAFVLFMFLFWIIPFSLIGGKWLRYTLALMPFIYMIAAVGVTALLTIVGEKLKSLRYGGSVASVAAVLIFVVAPASIAFTNNPHFSLYTNALAADKAGYYFPHDEFYDDGLREAMKFVCDTAPPGATMAHETPAVARYYLQKFSRTDLKSHALSDADFDPRTISSPTYFILQRGRTYFENRDKVAFIRANLTKVHEIQVTGLTACEIFVAPPRQ